MSNKVDELRERVAREIYATLHHLMRVTGAEAQAAYERAAKSVLELPDIANGLQYVKASRDMLYGGNAVVRIQRIDPAELRLDARAMKLVKHKPPVDTAEQYPERD